MSASTRIDRRGSLRVGTRAPFCSSPIFFTRIMLLLTLFGFGVIGSPLAPGESMAADAPRDIIVKYRSSGPNALDACAEALSRRGDAFQSATRDGSDSLDRIHRRYRMGHHRNLLGAPAGRAARNAATAASPASRLAERQTRLAARGRRANQAGRGRSPRARGGRAARRAQVEGQMASLAHVYRVEIPGNRSVDSAVAALMADPHVEYAQPDYANSIDQFDGFDQAAPFDDPFLSSEGSWGQPFADLWGAHRVGGPSTWPIADGTGAVVAVVDTGLDRFHPDIAANVWVNPGEDLNGDGIANAEDENGIDDDGNGFIDDLTGFDFANSVDVDGDGLYDGPNDISDPDPFDDRGHGTHVAGTIAAVGGNGLGIVGIAPGAKVMALKGFPAEGSAPDGALWRAVLYAAENGADVINTSWSCGRRCPVNPLAEEVLAVVESLGVVVVTSAGNSSEDVVFRSPENTSSAITVGSIGATDQLSAFSNRGWLVDLVAPGGGPNGTPGVSVSRRSILSLLSSGARENEFAFSVGGQYLRLAGTSMSAPHVAGAVAVLRASRPELTPRDVRHLLRLSAEDLAARGVDPELGAGLLDLPALVGMPMPDVTLAIDSPRAGAFHAPRDGVLPIEIHAGGSDLRAVSVAIGQGLSPREFTPLSRYGESIPPRRAGSDWVAEWDTEEVPDGPYVIRVQALLSDGRPLNEYTVVAVERNSPVVLSALTTDAGRPELDGSQVYWHRDEVTDGRGEAQVHDPFSMRFPSNSWLERGFEPTPRQIYDGEGDQRNLVADQDEIAWVVRRDGMNRIEHCRRPAGPEKCSPREVSQAPGSMTPPFLGQGWLTWMRTDGGQSIIEGCQVDRPDGLCVPTALIPPPLRADWLLQSFDGETLLLRSRTEMAWCRLDKSAAPACTPEPIEFPAGGSFPIEPTHFGDLMAFTQVDTALVLPPGCPPGVFTEFCLPEATLVVEYHACALEGTPTSCEPVRVSGAAPVEQAQGISVSERRIAWSMGSATESASIRFCEFDRIRKICPAQRVGGTPSFATQPAIEGDRIVWEDSRTGPVGIWGFKLPGIDPTRSVRVAAGKRFAFPIAARNGMSPSVDFELEGIEGVTLAAASAQVEDLVRKPRFVTTAWIRGVMPDDAEGTSTWLLHVRGEGGLSSVQQIEIEVRP